MGFLNKNKTHDERKCYDEFRSSLYLGVWEAVYYVGVDHAVLWSSSHGF